MKSHTKLAGTDVMPYQLYAQKLLSAVGLTFSTHTAKELTYISTLLVQQGVICPRPKLLAEMLPIVPTQKKLGDVLREMMQFKDTLKVPRFLIPVTWYDCWDDNSDAQTVLHFLDQFGMGLGLNTFEDPFMMGPIKVIEAGFSFVFFEEFTRR